MSNLRRVMPDPGQHVLDDGRGLWSVVIPEATTNLVTNGSFETNVTGWVAGGTGATIARSTTYSAFGAASLLLSDAAATGSEYASTAEIAVSASTAYTWSFYYRKTAAAGVTGTYRLDFYAAGSSYLSSVTGTLAAGNVNDWRRVALTVFTPATTVSVVLVHLTGASGAYNLYVDGVQLETKAYATTYVDGDQAGCFWNGTRHASSSYRPAAERRGGRVWNFRDFKWRTTAIIGAGAAALTTIGTPYALIGGGYYQRSVAPPRTFSVVGGFECDSQVDLARNRQALQDALSPFATNPQQLARLIYTPVGCENEIGKQIVIDAAYTGGLEGNQTSDSGTEKHALQFQTFAPIVIGQAITDSASSLALSASVTGYNIIRRDLATGVWSAPATTANGDIFAMKLAPDGSLYVVGDFTTIGGTSANRVARWNGSTWTALGTGLSGTGLDLDFGPDGTLYVVGSFATAGGTTVNNIASWNGSAWSAMASGFDTTTRAVRVGTNGYVYAAGQFTLSGATSVVGVAQWNGSAWSAMSTGLGGLAIGYALEIAPNGYVYLGGSFTTAGGTTVNNIARWNGSAWAALGSGTNDSVRSILFFNGILYAAGLFTTADSNTVNYVTYWNGSTWQSMNGGANGIVSRVIPGPDGTVLAGGAFTSIGGIAAEEIAVWRGSAWSNADISTNGSVGAGVTTREYWYLGGVGTAQTTSATTAVVNTTATAIPSFVFTGPGVVVSVRNWTTGARVEFNLTLLAGEVATLTLGPNPSFVSTFRGNLLTTILPGSDLSSFALQQGTNNISAFVTSTTGASAINLVYRPAFFGIDQALQ
jgi:hypothetical protein